MSTSRIPIAIWRSTHSRSLSSPPPSTTSSSVESSTSPGNSSENEIDECVQKFELTRLFPSRKSGNKFNSSMNWMKPLPGFKHGETHVARNLNLMDRIQETATLISQIENFFKPENLTACCNKSQTQGKDSDSQYYCDILKNEFEKEEKHQKMFQNKRNSNMSSIYRGRVVEWIISASAHFGYSTDTVFTAVYLMDTFLTQKTIKSRCWTLLGLTVLHVAGKAEEKNRVNLSKLAKQYRHLAKLTTQEVTWMEEEILKAAKYEVFPPTPKIFADLAFKSERISLPSSGLKRIIEKLAHEVLLHSLKEYDISQTKSSLRAMLAIEIATEYVMFYRAIFLKTTARTFDDLELVRNSRRVCSILLRAVLHHQFLSKETQSTTASFADGNQHSQRIQRVV